MPFTIGLDFGTNPVRALIVDCTDGCEIGTAVVDCPSGNQGVLLSSGDHHLARQNPADYVFALGIIIGTGLLQSPGLRPTEITLHSR